MMNLVDRKITFFLFISIVFAFVACRQEVVHNVHEDDANKVITSLHAVNIEATKNPQPDGSWSISVESSDAVKAIDYVQNARLIRREAENKSETSPSLLSSPEEHRLSYERRKSIDLAQSLETLRGVLEARVHLNLPRREDLFSKANSLESASVLLVVSSEFSVPITSIKGLVSGAVGVSEETVAVLVTIEKITDSAVDNKLAIDSPESELKFQDPVGVSTQLDFSKTMQTVIEVLSHKLVVTFLFTAVLLILYIRLNSRNRYRSTILLSPNTAGPQVTFLITTMIIARSIVWNL